MRNLIGLKFGKLTVIERDKDYVRPNDGKTRYKYKCKCECGNTISVLGNSLTQGCVNSCGCLRGKNLIKHGFSHKEKLYTTWKNMRQRCRCKKYYEKISICDEWNNYVNFREWALNNGYKDYLTIDRIDNNGNYCPQNCRWTTMMEQANNKSNNIRLTYNNETKTVSQWSKIVNIKADTIKRRLGLGWSVEKALTQKVRETKTKDELAEMAGYGFDKNN